MRDVPTSMTAAWFSGLFIGDQRPMARVTIQQTALIPDELTETNLFMSFMGNTNLPRELPNVKSVEWDRTVDQDAATCTITLYNIAPLPIGTPVTRDLDQPGYYTYNRGGTTYSERWGHQENEWSNFIMPDQTIRTFEGYGFDPDIAPESDPHLVQTGVWLIDDVDYTHDGLITITCRDYGRLLIDQIAFPPVVPFEAGDKNDLFPEGMYSYPVSFVGPSEHAVGGSTTSGGPIALTYDASSNEPYVGDGPVYGHVGKDAFDSDEASYWLSIGNSRPDAGYSFEWVQGRMKAGPVRKVRFRTRGTGYKAFIGIYQNGKWLGDHTVPYDPNHPTSAPNGSNQKYVASTVVTSEGWHEVTIPEGLATNATLVRVTFTSLWNSGLGPYKYRAAVRELTASGSATAHGDAGLGYNYKDYTDIIKLFCAWAGFFWPRSIAFMVGEVPGDEPYYETAELVRERVAAIRENRGLPPDPASDEIWVQRIFYDQTHTIGDARDAIDFEASNMGVEELLSDGMKRYWGYVKDDRWTMTIDIGRVWGDFMQTGTYGPAELTPDIFDKKPLMDCIAYIRDIVGFLFYVDELGGAVWRPPNVYSVGNWMLTGSERAGERTRRMISIDERQTLLSLGAKLSSRNIRERTFIANLVGRFGAMAKGYNPNPTGIRRVGGWSDQRFVSEEECRLMADMIALRQLFSYRTDSVVIPGYPAIQPDDQVRIFEAVTSEGFIHYVKGIASSNDLEAGEWTYNLSTHWLGERPFDKWAFTPDDLAPETQQFIDYLTNSPTRAVDL